MAGGDEFSGDFHEGRKARAALQQQGREALAAMPPALRAPVHRKLVQALRPGGLLILEAFHPDQLPLSSGGPKDVAMLYTLAMLRADFADMTELLAEETDAVLDEGSGHQGPAKVTRWIGQR